MCKTLWDRIGLTQMGGGMLFRRAMLVLAILCIPLLALSIYYVNDRTEAIVLEEQKQLQTVTQAVLAQFDEFIDGMRANDIRIKGDPLFLSSIQNDSISDEMRLIKSLKLMKTVIPYVSDFGVFVPEQSVLYLSTGKYRSQYFAKSMLGIDEEEFLSLLSEQKNPCFISWYPKKKLFSFIIPASIGTSSSLGFVGYYQLENSLLISSLKSVLPSPYKLYMLETESGDTLYRSEWEVLEEQNLYYTQMGRSGVKATVYVARSHLTNTLDQLNISIRFVFLLSIVALTVLSLAISWIGYRPILRVFRRVRSSSSLGFTGKNEVEYILDAFEVSMNERTYFRKRLQEEHRLLENTILEKILLGKTVSPAERELVPLMLFDCFCIICARPEALIDVDALMTDNYNKYHAVEVYSDGVVAFICHLPEDDADSINSVVQLIRSQSDGRGDTVLGISRVAHSWDEAAEMYHGALQTLRMQQMAMDNPSDVGPYDPETDRPHDAFDRSAELQKQISHYTDEHFCDADYCATAVADAFQISEYMAGKMLREIYGANYSRLINDRRIDLAKSLLLTTGEPISAIAEKVGFRSSSYFIRLFRGQEGVSPSAWRKYMREQKT